MKPNKYYTLQSSRKTSLSVSFFFYPLLLFSRWHIPSPTAAPNNFQQKILKINNCSLTFPLNTFSQYRSWKRRSGGEREGRWSTVQTGLWFPSIPSRTLLDCCSFPFVEKEKERVAFSTVDTLYQAAWWVSVCWVISPHNAQLEVSNKEQSVCFLAWSADRKNSASIKVPGPSPPLKSKLSDSCRTCDERKDSQVVLGPAESHSPEERASVPWCCCASRQLVWDDEVLPCCLHFKPPTSC